MQKPLSSDWGKVYDILADAYREKVYSRRRRKLREGT